MNKLNNNEALQMNTVMPTMKKSLLALAVAGTMAMSGGAYAAPTEMSATTFNATDVDGLIESGTASVTATMDNGTDFILGANGTTSLSITGDGANADLIVNIGGITADTDVTFADDIVANAHANASITINSVGDASSITLQGNVTETLGDISILLGVANESVTVHDVVVDTSNNENINIDATIASLDADDTTTISINNTDGNANTVTFSDAIGGAGASIITALNIGQFTTTTFSSTIGAATITNSSANTTTFGGDVTGAVVYADDGTISVAANKKIVGATITNNNNKGTLTFGTTTTEGGLILSSGAVGTSSASLKAVNVTVTDADSTGGASSGTISGAVYATTVTATATSADIDDVSDGDTVIFSSTINATTLNLDGSGIFTLGGDVTAAVVISGDSTSTVAADQIIVGAVTNDSGAAAGTLTFAATTTNTTLASSTIGATTAAEYLKAVNVTSTANTATLAGNVFATTVTATATDATGSDSIAFGGSVTGDTLTLVGTGTFKFDDVVTTAVDANLIDGAKIILTKGIASGDTVFAATQAATALAGASVGAVVVTMPETLNTGSINFIDYVGATTGAADAALLTVGNSKLATYAAAVGSDSTIAKITATAKSAATIASELSITTDQANALYNATTSAAGTASSLTAIDTVLNATVTESNVEQLQPDAGAANGAALAAVGGVNNVIAGRQASTRVAFNTLGKQSGVSTGDEANDAVVWAQIFGSTATQDKVGTIDGYETDSQGLALGWEADKSGDLMGLSVSYSDADVDGKSASASHTDTTATQVAAYGTYGKATDWMVGYASADNDTKRTVNFGGLNLVASGKYDSNIFSAKVGHAFASSETNGWTMTPKVDASYTNVDNDGYTETGANNLNLIVASSSNDILTARAGAEFTQRIVDGDAVTIPHVNIMAGYDLKNDGASTTSTFTGGGAAFTTTAADPEKASLQLGFGVDHVSDDSTVSLDLNADLRSDYDSMSGSITFKSKF